MSDGQLFHAIQSELTGQSPSSLELKHGVVRAQEDDKAIHNAALDDPVDGWVLLLAEELAELGGGVKLGVEVVGEDSLYHSRELICAGTTLALVSRLVRVVAGRLEVTTLSDRFLALGCQWLFGKRGNTNAVA